MRAHEYLYYLVFIFGMCMLFSFVLRGGDIESIFDDNESNNSSGYNIFDDKGFLTLINFVFIGMIVSGFIGVIYYSYRAFASLSIDIPKREKNRKVKVEKREKINKEKTITDNKKSKKDWKEEKSEWEF